MIVNNISSVKSRQNTQKTKFGQGTMLNPALARRVVNTVVETYGPGDKFLQAFPIINPLKVDDIGRMHHDAFGLIPSTASTPSHIRRFQSSTPPKGQKPLMELIYDEQTGIMTYKRQIPPSGHSQSPEALDATTRHEIVIKADGNSGNQLIDALYRSTLKRLGIIQKN